MPGEDNEADAAAVATSASSVDKGSSAASNGNNRKRRISKRERKNLKKKSRPASTTAAATATASESATNNEQTTSSPSSDAPTDADNSSAAQRTTRKKSEPSLEEYMANYIPAPSAKLSKQDGEEEDGDDDSKSLGKWFPKASVIKSSVCYSNDILAKLAKDKKKKLKAKAAAADANKSKNSNSNNANVVVVETAQEEPKASLVLFYQYVSPTWSQAKVSSFLSYLTTIAQKHRTNTGGRVRVSTEGVNATISAASTTTTSSSSSERDPAFEAAQTLRHFTQDLRQFDPVAFADTDFKYIDGLSADRHFKELKLLPVKELVFYGIREGDCAVESGKKKKTLPADVDSGAESKKESKGGKEVKGGIHLDAKDYHEMLKRKDAVVIDVRNHYEAAIGRFDGQMMATDDSAKDSMQVSGEKDVAETKEEAAAAAGSGGAEYIDPKMRKSTDFTSWLAAPETKQKLEGKTVMMFCTGGIRCERASAYLNSQMGSQVNGVYQLQGGVERYLQAFPEGGFWKGKNFVFDKREAIGVGNVNGDGGVVRKDTTIATGGTSESRKDGGASSKKKGKDNDDDNKLLPWGTECAKCHKPWDRYIGKRKCYTCGVPVLVCDTCMSQSTSTHNKKKKGKNKSKKKDEDDGVGKAEAKKEDDDVKGGVVDKSKKKEESNERIRCPLCIEEGVTVAAEDVEWTDNGVRGKLRSSEGGGGLVETGGGVTSKADKSKDKKDTNKAAKSVLKWGGGHATKKKEKRKFSRRLCQFGTECARKDCFFNHPERREKKSRKVSGK